MLSWQINTVLYICPSPDSMHGSLSMVEKILIVTWSHCLHDSHRVHLIIPPSTDHFLWLNCLAIVHSTMWGTQKPILNVIISIMESTVMSLPSQLLLGISGFITCLLECRKPNNNGYNQDHNHQAIQQLPWLQLPIITWYPLFSSPGKLLTW